MRKLETILAISILGIAMLFSGCNNGPELEFFSVSPNSVTLNTEGQTQDLIITIMPEDADVDFKWSSGNNAVVTVEKTGKLTARVKAIGNGSTEIMVKSGDESKPVSVTVNISGGPIIVDGDGSEASPYSVTQVVAKFAASAAQENDVWVNGYIVGGVKTTLAGGAGAITVAEDIVWGATDVRPAAVVIADDPNERNWQKIVIVKLTPEPEGTALADFQNTINLNNRPCNIGKTLKVKGNLWRYFTQPAVREVSAFTSNSIACPGAEGLLSETLLSQESFDKFTIVNITGEKTWEFSSSYGALMSGYNGSGSDPNEDWFITPAIDLSSATDPKLSFDHARGPAGSINVGVAEGWYKVYATANYTGDVVNTTWVEITGIIHGTAAWGFVSSGSVAIPAAAKSATTRIAFKYFNDATGSATWEIKNVLVK